MKQLLWTFVKNIEHYIKS